MCADNNTSGRIWNNGNTIGVMDEGDELLTLIEAAKETGYSTERLRQFAVRGEMPARQYGRQWLVQRAALRRFLAGHRPHTGRPRGSKNRPAPPDPA